METNLLPVSSDFGGPNTLAYQDETGTGISDATVRVYKREDYQQSRRSFRYIVAGTTTDESGRLIRPLLLAPGWYIMVFAKGSAFGPDTVTLKV